MAGNTAGLGCSGCRAESEVLRCAVARAPSESLSAQACHSEKDADYHNAQRLCPVARKCCDASQVHECDGFDLIRTGTWPRVLLR